MCMFNVCLLFICVFNGCLLFTCLFITMNISYFQNSNQCESDNFRLFIIKFQIKNYEITKIIKEIYEFK